MIKPFFSVVLKLLSLINALLSHWRTRIFISSILFIVFAHAYWPGVMFSDSYVQLEQALSGKFDDWHPPIMAWLWSKLIIFGKNTENINIYNNIFPMLLFHLGMLFSASFLMSCCKNKNGTYPWYWLFFPLVPHVIGYIGFLIKDVGMAFALFMVFALIRIASIQQNIISRISICIISFLFFVYALLIRHNAILALPPIIYYFFLIFFHNIHKKIIFIIVIICCPLMIISTYIINYHFIKASKSNLHRVMYIDRICVASHYAKKNLFYVYPYNNYDYKELPKNYKEGARWHFYASDPVDFELLKRNYYDVIMYYPLSFIKGKLLRIKQFIFTRVQEKLSYEDVKVLPFYFRPSIVSDNDLLLSRDVLRLKQNSLMHLVEYYVLDLFYYNFGVLFDRVFIILLGIIIFFLFYKNNTLSGFQIKMLASSGVLYFFSYILVTPSPDYRFVYWNFFSIVLSLCLLIEYLFKVGIKLYIQFKNK